MGFQSGGMGSCRRTLDSARPPPILGKNIIETGGQRSLLRTLRSSATTKALRATTHILWAWTEDKPQDADIRPAALAETVRLLHCLTSVSCRTSVACKQSQCCFVDKVLFLKERHKTSSSPSTVASIVQPSDASSWQISAFSSSISGEDWSSWTPNLTMHLPLPPMQVQYTASTTCSPVPLGGRLLCAASPWRTCYRG